MFTWVKVADTPTYTYYKLLTADGGHVASLQPFLGYWRVVCMVTLGHTNKSSTTAHEIPSVPASADPPFELALGLFLLSWEG
jgi:hypothetical protein